MSFNQHILEKGTFVSGVVPVALNTNPGATSDYISMKGYARCTIIFFKAAGTAGDDPTLTVSQAKTVAGGSAKALPYYRVDKKQAATNQLSTGTFATTTNVTAQTNDTLTPASGTWTNTDLAEQTALVIIDISVDQMDIDLGFDCLICNVGDVGTNAQLGCLLYYLHEPRYSQATAPSAIAD